MGYFCFVPQCSSNSKWKKEKFHVFPKDITRRKLWINNISSTKQPSRHSRVCSRHFEDDCYIITSMGEWRILKETSVPTLHLPKVMHGASSKIGDKHRRRVAERILQKAVNADTFDEIDCRIGEEANAKEDVSEIVIPKMEIKTEPPDSDGFFTGEENLSDTCISEVPVSFKPCTPKVEKEEEPSRFNTINNDINKTASAIFTCALCAIVYASENTFNNHFVMSGDFFLCRNVLEMNQPFVKLVRIDTGCKSERGVNNIQSQVEGYNSISIYNEQSRDMKQSSFSEVLAEEGLECHKELNMKSALVNNVKCDFSKKRQLKCDKCTRIFLSKARMQAHLPFCKSSMRRAQICFVCSKKFERKECLQNHIESKHPGATKFNCTDCFQYCTSKRCLTKQLLAQRSTQHLCALCSKVFASKSIFYQHLQEKHPKRVPFQCNYCPKIFVKKFEYIDHLDNCHIAPAENQNFCSVCSIQFPHYRALCQHFVHKHPKEFPLKCNKCLYKFSCRFSLARHVRKCHLSKFTYVCSNCLVQFTSKLDLYKHVMVHSKTNTLQCNDCSKNFSNFGKFETHKCNSLRKLEGNIFCPICLNEFPRNPRVLLEHIVQKHLESTTLKCHICSKKFFSKFAFCKHLCKCSLYSAYICPFCAIVFSNESRFLKHFTRKHPNSMPFHCNYCLLEFSYSKSLKNHLQKCPLKIYWQRTKRHSLCTKGFNVKSNPVKKLWHCNGCLKNFYKKTTLAVHISKCPQLLSRICFACSATYSMETDLDNCKTLRSKQSLFACKIVAKKYKPSDNYADHINNTRGLVCRVCSKPFPNRYSLDSHLSKCLLTKPTYFCHICSANFVSRDSTVFHVMQSHRKDAFACQPCLMNFTACVSLANHLNECHSIESVDLCGVCVVPFDNSHDLFRHMQTH